MSPKILTFSEKTAERLMYMLDAWERESMTTQGRPRVDEPLQYAPDVYMAQVPDDGLPAATGTGTGETVPSASCQVFKLFQNSIIKVNTLTKKVYNFSSLDIEGGSLVPIMRDKFGTWIAIPDVVSGTSTPVIGQSSHTGTYSGPGADTPWTITLPSFGTYLISANVTGKGQCSAIGSSITPTFYATLGSRTMTVFHVSATGRDFYGSVSWSFFWQSSGSETLTLSIQESSGSGETWTSFTIGDVSEGGGTWLMYQKLSDSFISF